MPLYKVKFDKHPADVVYLTRRVLVYVHPDGGYATFRLAVSFKRWLEWASALGSVDKVTEPERKMFWLVFAPTLRTIGVIK